MSLVINWPDAIPDSVLDMPEAIPDSVLDMPEASTCREQAWTGLFGTVRVDNVNRSCTPRKR